MIGLAARTPSSGIPDEDLPATLYEYFAEELYQGTDEALRDHLRALAIAPRLTRGSVTALLGDDAARTP